MLRSIRAARWPTSHSDVVATSLSYGNGPPIRVASPFPGGSGSQCAAVWVPHAAQSVT